MRRLVAVSNAQGAHVRGPANLVAAAPLPINDARLGCALLAPRVVGVAPGADTAASPAWRRRGHTLGLEYNYADTGPFPARVSESVDGAVRLAITFTSVEARSFAAADFAPPQPGGAR